MATAVTDTTPATRPDPTRRLWQVPVFLLGAAAFVAAWQGWLPLSTPDPALAFLKELAALRAAAERANPDAGELKSLLSKAAAGAEAFPEHAPAAHFALGSAYARLAELTPSPDEARGHWELARQHLERVKGDQLPDPADPPRLAFRAAKARAAAGLPTTATTAEVELYQKLLINVPPGEDPGEANRLLAQLYLQSSPSDPKRAKEALTAYLTEAGLSTPPASLARAKLRLSELHLLTSDTDQARKWLNQVASDAPPDVLATAKAQLGRILMREGNYPEAAKAWEVVRASPALPAGLRTAAAYYLGECRVAARQLSEAAKLFDEATKAEGPEGQAAAVRLADICLQATDPGLHKRAGVLLASAVKGVKGPAEFASPLVRLNEVQAAFEAAVQSLVTDGAFEEAAGSVEAYKVVATAGKDREKRAEVLAAWGTSLKKTGGEFRPKFAAAAKEYAALAEEQPAATAKVDLLRRTAAMYRQAEDADAALAAVEQAVKLPEVSDDAAGPVWIEYAEALLGAKRWDDALRAFKETMARGGPTATAARYRLARILIDSRDPKKAPLGTDLLDQIAAAAVVEPAERETQERAMVELADMDVRAGNYAAAVVRLRKQLNLYPAGPESGVGRLLLGLCLLQRAEKPADGPDAAFDPAKLREEALAHLRGVVDELDRKEKTSPGGKLPERDEWLRLQAGLRVVQCYLYMHKPGEVLVHADPLIQRHRGTVEELIVLSFVWHAQQGLLKKPEDAARTKDRMREVFNQLPPAAFRGTSDDYSREVWEKKWFGPAPTAGGVR